MTRIPRAIRNRIVRNEYSRLPQMNSDRTYQEMQATTSEKYAQDHIGPFPESEHQKPYENPEEDYQELEALYTPFGIPPFVGPWDLELPTTWKVCKALPSGCYCPGKTTTIKVSYSEEDCCNYVSYDLIHTSGTFTIKASCFSVTITASADASGPIIFTAHRSADDLGTDFIVEACTVNEQNCVGDDAEATTIDYSLQMSAGTSQTLTAMHTRAGASYHWEISAGGGTLDKNVGASVVYTAPATNPNCANNPTIKLTTGSKGCVANPLCATAQITISNNTGTAAWMHVQDAAPFDCYFLGGWRVGWQHHGLRCDDTTWIDSSTSIPGASCDEIKLYIEETYPGYWDAWEDTRTAEQLAAGCCPYKLM